ncbi:MAG TPA: hypothetical protein VGP24_05915 [Glaciihabitans sp.]|nr:hypothetical protein [Glaciihabitans sp.]
MDAIGKTVVIGSAFIAGMLCTLAVEPAPQPPRTVIHELKVPGPSRTVTIREPAVAVVPSDCSAALDMTDRLWRAWSGMRADPERQLVMLDRAHKAIADSDINAMVKVVNEINAYKSERSGTNDEVARFMVTFGDTYNRCKVELK